MKNQSNKLVIPNRIPVSDHSPLLAIDHGGLPAEEEMFKQIMLTVETAWRNHISKDQIERWLSNFKGTVFSKNEERRLALWLLTCFVYYNESEVRHLCKTVYHDFLHQELSNESKLPSYKDIRHSVDTIHSTTRFYHLGSPSESGAFILYFFRQANDLGVEDFLHDINEIPPHVKKVVFIDDVTLSGRQAKRYLRKYTDRLRGREVFLLTLCSTAAAQEHLLRTNITVLSAIELDSRCKCFSPESGVFEHYPSYKDKCRTLAEQYGRLLSPECPLGFDGGQYAFSFFYNTPNNTLPIFWSERRNWVPILKRYRKPYGKVTSHALGRFV